MLGRVKLDFPFVRKFQYLGGSLAKILSTHGRLEEKVAINYTQQIIRGVAYLHEHHVIPQGYQRLEYSFVFGQVLNHTCMDWMLEQLTVTGPHLK